MKRYTFPDEIVLSILLYLQPPYALAELPGTSTPWNEGRCNNVEEIWNSSLPGIKPLEVDARRFARNSFHPTIRVSLNGEGRRAPALICASHVSQQWRRVAFSHPFWTELAWHRLIKRPDCKPRSMHVRNLDKFMRAMSESHYRMRRIRSVWWDLKSHGFAASLETLLEVLARIPDPTQVHTMVLDCPLIQVSDPKLLKVIASRFTRLSRLHLRGVDDSTECYTGLASSDVRLLALKLEPNTLTHLSINTGVAHGSMSWRSVKMILDSQPHITHLNLGYVKGGIDFEELSSALPNLASLGITFFAGHAERAHFEPMDDLVVYPIIRLPTALLDNNIVQLPKLLPRLKTFFLSSETAFNPYVNREKWPRPWSNVLSVLFWVLLPRLTELCIAPEFPIIFCGGPLYQSGHEIKLQALRIPYQQLVTFKRSNLRMDMLKSLTVILSPQARQFTPIDIRTQLNYSKPTWPDDMSIKVVSEDITPNRIRIF
ncbi:hypothetical protein BC832DRAFT_221124 [Gaertneriomyces semiglobifer]|nr:hypothetical protein BC832DRAFT_221124 [Gaertneriomyces semiglobifer]